MKRYFMILVALAVAVTLASPALAAVEFKYGGQFKNRIHSSNNTWDGSDEGSDNLNFLDQRLRLYFTFQASENLKLVWKMEVGDTTWGNDWPTAGTSTLGKGGRVGSDAQNVETKNAYIDFNIPNTPVKIISGIQTLNLLNSWIVDDDFSAIVAKAKFEPFAVTLGYVAAQNYDLSHYVDNIDSFFFAFDWVQKPFSASLIGYYQYGRDTIASVWPWTRSPLGNIGNSTTSAAFFPYYGSLVPSANDMFRNGLLSVSDNSLFDLGLNFSYKIDWLSAYVTFVKNLGSFDVNIAKSYPLLPPSTNPTNYTKFRSMDYTGWMVDAGVTYYCAPWTANIGGFYTSGQESPSSKVVGNIFSGLPVDPYQLYFISIDSFKGNDLDRFVMPLSQTKYSSEIIGGGILGDTQDRGNGPFTGDVQRGNFWEGYASPFNIWTITVGGSYQLLPKTKLSASYWYFNTSEDVPVALKKTFGIAPNGDIIARYEMDSQIGHEFDVYLDHEIVDGLQLTLVGAYLVAGDAFCPINRTLSANPNQIFRKNADDAYELGARLQWNF
ncbi:MAG TPA: hypothetical protein PLM79_09130 [Syntrophobacteraceae bacterium]|nr:hypothetical protein [Syntrophobacteraceae bacterium]